MNFSSFYPSYSFATDHAKFGHGQFAPCPIQRHNFGNHHMYLRSYRHYLSLYLALTSHGADDTLETNCLDYELFQLQASEVVFDA